MESKELRLKRFHLILLMIFMFLGGCAQKISPPKEQNSQTLTDLQRLSHWTVKGKVAFITKAKKQSATLNWLYKEPYHRINLTSFLGINVLKLDETQSGAVIEISDETYRGENTEELLWRLTGFSLPVDKAHLWLSARLPLEQALYDQWGRLVSGQWTDASLMTWQINYDKFIDNQGMWLPSRITLKNDRISIKLQINEWVFQ